MNVYTTRTDAIDAIVATIEASGVVTDARAEYDIDAIADSVIGVAIAEGVLGDYEAGYAIAVDEGAFWTIVTDNEL